MTFIEPVRQSVRLAKGYDRLAYMFDRLAYGFDRFNWPLRQNYLGWFSKLLAGDFLAELNRRGATDNTPLRFGCDGLHPPSLRCDALRTF